MTEKARFVSRTHSSSPGVDCRQLLKWLKALISPHWSQAHMGKGLLSSLWLHYHQIRARPPDANSITVVGRRLPRFCRQKQSPPSLVPNLLQLLPDPISERSGPALAFMFRSTCLTSSSSSRSSALDWSANAPAKAPSGSEYSLAPNPPPASASAAELQIGFLRERQTLQSSAL